MADDQGPHDWQLLSCIFNSLGRLDHPLYQPLAHDDYPREYRLLALESALRSREIPMRGRRVTSLGLAPSERIETKIDAETAIDIPLDEITLCKVHPERAARIEFAVFKWMQADMASVEQWLRENILPAGGTADDDYVEECLPENTLRADPVVDEPQAEEKPKPPQSKKRSQPKRDPAKRLLLKMFPNGVPSKDELPDQALLAKCKGAEWNGISPDTIARAAAELRDG